MTKMLRCLYWIWCDGIQMIKPKVLNSMNIRVKIFDQPVGSNLPLTEGIYGKKKDILSFVNLPTRLLRSKNELE